MSLSELTALVCSTYNLPGSTELEIADRDHYDALQLESIFHREGIIDPDTQNIRPSHKILAIKRLRELVVAKDGDCGLATAKYAIEDWPRFLAYVKLHGFPDMNGTYTTPWVEMAES